MTEPTPFAPSASVPTWRARLLDRIQNLAADRARVLQQGYQITEGAGDSAVLAWRTQLQLLAISREETVTQALSVGISRIDVGDALLQGHQGFRAPLDMVEPGDRVREMMIDGVVNDTWQLQHMAAIHVVRDQQLPSDAHYFEDPQVPAQYERNMAALWMRATTVSQAISLTPAESAGMWATDPGGWQQIIGASVATYDAAGLEERWRIYAWPGIAESAHRDLTALGIDPSHADAISPIPGPHTMFEHVTQALRAGPGNSEAHIIGQAVDAALASDTDLQWPPFPTPDNGAAPPKTDASPGVEL
ncbi:hypothetical protein [Nocardia sp. NPDC006630]|uniref:hypothetical protein n=1 Tax=Nocardia sp. NPDC006630 TaxID=3157181 RepID=UPI0033B000B8